MTDPTFKDPLPKVIFTFIRTDGETLVSEGMNIEDVTDPDPDTTVITGTEFVSGKALEITVRYTKGK